MAKLVPLTQGKFAIVSDQDYKSVMFHSWYAMHNKGKWYAAAKMRGKNVYLHRFIMNPPNELDIDHLDHDGLNNCRSNLRVSTRAQNLQARQTYSQYGYKGVIWNDKRQKWEGYIVVKKKQIYLGIYVNIEDAALAYDKAALQYYGEWAFQNFDTRPVVQEPIWHNKDEILLVGGGVVYIDEEDWDKLYPYRWRLHTNQTGCKRVVRGEGLRMIYMHREILGVSDPKVIVDHKDGIGWNNQKENLRPRDKKRNAENQKIERTNNTTGYKGVSFSRLRRKFVAQIMHNYKHITIGYFDSAEEAALAYDGKAIELFEFPRLNFPQ